MVSVKWGVVIAYLVVGESVGRHDCGLSVEDVTESELMSDLESRDGYVVVDWQIACLEPEVWLSVGVVEEGAGRSQTGR